MINLLADLGRAAIRHKNFRRIITHKYRENPELRQELHKALSEADEAFFNYAQATDQAMTSLLPQEQLREELNKAACMIEETHSIIVVKSS